MQVRVGTSADDERSLQAKTSTSTGWSCRGAAPVQEDAQTLSPSRLPKQSPVDSRGTWHTEGAGKTKAQGALSHAAVTVDTPRQPFPLETIMPLLHTAGQPLSPPPATKSTSFFGSSNMSGSQSFSSLTWRPINFFCLCFHTALVPEASLGQSDITRAILTSCTNWQQRNSTAAAHIFILQEWIRPYFTLRKP